MQVDEAVEFAKGNALLTYLTYADVCGRMRTYADVCRRMDNYKLNENVKKGKELLRGFGGP